MKLILQITVGVFLAEVLKQLTVFLIYTMIR